MFVSEGKGKRTSCSCLELGMMKAVVYELGRFVQRYFGLGRKVCGFVKACFLLFRSTWGAPAPLLYP